MQTDWQQHSNRVAQYTINLYKLIFPNSKNLERLEISLAALYHDIGKKNIPEEILNKPGRLTDNEFTIVKQHTNISQEDVSHYCSFLSEKEQSMILIAIREHHERYDGKGYPNGLSKNKISLIGRICAIADSFDAIISDRCYQAKRTKEEAFKILKEEAGKQFDPFFIKIALNDTSWTEKVSL